MNISKRTRLAQRICSYHPGTQHGVAPLDLRCAKDLNKHNSPYAGNIRIAAGMAMAAATGDAMLITIESYDRHMVRTNGHTRSKSGACG